MRGTALGLLALTTAALLFAAMDLDSSVGLWLIMAAALTAPGWAVCAYLLPLPASLEWTLAVTFSLVGSIVLSVGMLLVGWWHPKPVMIGYLLLTCVALAMHLLRPRSAVGESLVAATAGPKPAADQETATLS